MSGHIGSSTNSLLEYAAMLDNSASHISQSPGCKTKGTLLDEIENKCRQDYWIKKELKNKLKRAEKRIKNLENMLSQQNSKHDDHVQKRQQTSESPETSILETSEIFIDQEQSTHTILSSESINTSNNSNHSPTITNSISTTLSNKSNHLLSSQTTSSANHSLSSQATSSTNHSLSSQTTSSTNHSLSNQTTSSTNHSLTSQTTSLTNHSLTSQATPLTNHSLTSQTTSSTNHSLSSQTISSTNDLNQSPTSHEDTNTIVAEFFSPIAKKYGRQQQRSIIKSSYSSSPLGENSPESHKNSCSSIQTPSSSFFFSKKSKRYEVNDACISNKRRRQSISLSPYLDESSNDNLHSDSLSDVSSSFEEKKTSSLIDTESLDSNSSYSSASLDSDSIFSSSIHPTCAIAFDGNSVLDHRVTFSCQNSSTTTSEVIKDLERYSTAKFYEMDKIIEKMRKKNELIQCNIFKQENKRMKKNLKMIRDTIRAFQKKRAMKKIDELFNGITEKELLEHIAIKFHDFLGSSEDISRITAIKLVSRASNYLKKGKQEH